MTLKVYHFHHAFFQFLQLAFEGNPTAVLGEDAGATVTEGFDAEAWAVQRPARRSRRRWEGGGLRGIPCLACNET